MPLFDRIIESTCDIVEDLAEDIAEFADDSFHAVEDFLTSPIQHTVETVEDLSEATVYLAKSNPVGSTIEGVIDSFRDAITEPERGSVLYTDLLFGMMEHSGIYIGNNRIVELNSQGEVSIVTPSEFISGGTGINIYVSCIDENPIGCEVTAQRAERMVGTKKNYHLLNDNCHIFCSGCLTGDFNNNETFLWMLQQNAQELLNANTWRIWDVDLS
ncbi:lecithin retinol acyltransferase family protein [Lentisphaerota bacterium WC36G]|nr:lecithin retinol acyltransferase family protein [Lentisphaerae bacterium WC36]